MSITYPLTPPSCLTAARVNWGLNTAIAISRNEYTFEQQAQEYDGSGWTLEITPPPLDISSARDLLAFIAALKGPKGTFSFGVPSMRTPRGAATGTPLVKGGGQMGQELITDGWSASITNILRKGDFIQVGTRLFVVLSDVNSDGSGNATLDIWPNIISAPADNAPIITSDPKGLFRLAGNRNGFSGDKERIFDFPISAEEAL